MLCASSAVINWDFYFYTGYIMSSKEVGEFFMRLKVSRFYQQNGRVVYYTKVG